jgi:hypothetical protein
MKKENNEIEEQHGESETMNNTYKTVHAPCIPDIHGEESQKPTNIQKTLNPQKNNIQIKYY